MNLTKHPVVVASLIVLLAALIIAGALVYTRPRAAAVSGYTEPSQDFVPATADSPAHLKPPEGQANPAASLIHYGSYQLQRFTVTSVSASSVTGTIAGQKLTLAITSATSIYAQGEKKSPDQYAKEMSDFHQRLQYADTKDIYIAPDIYKEIPKTSADITPGMTVLVSSADGKTADVIEISPLSASPQATPTR